MRFQNRSIHDKYKGTHAFLSPSYYHWVNYDISKLDARYETYTAAERGTKLHEFAAMAIELRQNMPRTKKTLNMFINDAIGYRMTPEQMLFYSPNCYGTADAIGLTKNTLRIFDLKTGTSKTSELQLYIYAALFCLEYGYNPGELRMDCRIYQNDECRMYEPTPPDILDIMDKIELFNDRIENLKDM